MKKETYIVIGVAVILIVGAIVWGVNYKSQPGELDKFAQCLEEKGVVFYGAFWCSNCQSQKAKFGKSAKLLPYIECSTPDGRSQIKYCSDKNIESYPTWEFADGEREIGDVNLSLLAEKSGCNLPQ